jgi:hypothetical protein
MADSVAVGYDRLDEMLASTWLSQIIGPASPLPRRGPDHGRAA